MVFLFWTIAVGLGCGTYNWAVVIVSTIVISLVMIALYFLQYGRSTNTDYILVVSGKSGGGDDASLETAIREFAEEVRMRSHEVSDGFFETIFELRFPRSIKQVNKNMVPKIQSMPGIQKVSLLAPQLALPV